jgi:hypothetical protein
VKRKTDSEEVDLAGSNKVIKDEFQQGDTDQLRKNPASRDRPGGR